ncbi:ATP-binding protein [Actinoplanes sp. NPDC049118]|uniref:ATP-binding protein n=1 Tax=Actinoplanes sp. NPDC049118 TaxID=3155769 RepID=UPI0033CEB079
MPVELKPPYLINHAPARGDGRVAVTADVAGAVIEVAVHGRWNPSLRMDAWAAVTKCFAQHPPTVIVDLHDLGDPMAASAPAWWTMGTAGAAMRPPVSVAVCLPTATALAARLNRIGAKRHLSVFATMPEAHIAVAGRSPMVKCFQLPLAPRPDAVYRARSLIAEACEAWRLPRLLGPGRLVVAELVANAVEYAGTDVVVTVCRRGTGLHLAVSDGDPRLPRLLDPPPPDRSTSGVRGRGLHAVHAAAIAWGAMPTATGKVVWAVPRPEPA